MKYIVLNKSGIIVDILNFPQYTKRNRRGNLIITDIEKATGVIGSDYNTNYNFNNYTLLTLETIPDRIIPDVYRYNLDTEEFEYTTELVETERYSRKLERVKQQKQSENKQLLAAFLTKNPLTWTDGKQYGITMEDQTEISLRLNQYQAAQVSKARTVSLNWHAQKEIDQPWTYEDLTDLLLSINDQVYYFYHQCQEYKDKIYNCQTIGEVNKININFQFDNSDL